MGAPALANTLQSLNAGDALFLRLRGAAELRQPDLLAYAEIGTQVDLRPGWNLVIFFGADGTPLADLLPSYLGVRAAFLFDAQEQRWRSYFPQGPAFLNDLLTVDRGDILYISSTAFAQIGL